jgi:hypothetical protein
MNFPFTNQEEDVLDLPKHPSWQLNQALPHGHQ